jgi:hypothetical protein
MGDSGDPYHWRPLRGWDRAGRRHRQRGVRLGQDGGWDTVPSRRVPGPVQLGGELLVELVQLVADGRVLQRALAPEPPAEPGDGGGSGGCLGAGASLEVVAVFRGAGSGSAVHRAPWSVPGAGGRGAGLADRACQSAGTAINRFPDGPAVAGSGGRGSGVMRG